MSEDANARLERLWREFNALETELVQSVDTIAHKNELYTHMARVRAEIIAFEKLMGHRAGAVLDR